MCGWVPYWVERSKFTVSSAVIGLLFGLLFLLTGTLLLPMVLHCVMDLRMLAMLRPPTSVAA